MYGPRHKVKAVWLECITEVKHAPMVKLLRGMFPEDKEDVAGAFFRPPGKVDVVLGKVTTLQATSG